jgi:heat shock protein HslJ
MRSIIVLAASVAALVLAGCSAADPETRKRAGPTPPSDLDGRWRILSVDGAPLAGSADAERPPTVVFRGHQFGANVGCNQFGGLMLLADGHLAVHSLASTQIGCPDEVGRQEQTLGRLFLGRPRLVAAGDRLRLESPGHAAELQRLGPDDQAPMRYDPADLSGTTWRIVAVDGLDASTTPAGRRLRFESGAWQGLAACATLSGTWRAQGDRIIIGPEISSTEQACPEALVVIDGAFAALMRSNPRYLVGPNGELLMAGDGHALAAEAQR